MTCKDCIHYDVCMDYTFLEGSEFAQDFDETDILCEHFKSKSDYAEVKHGEWMKHKPNPEVMRAYHALGMHKGMSENSIYWTCSKCEKWGEPYNKYCPNCGAKMDGRKDT